jgi:hypothetical protein
MKEDIIKLAQEAGAYRLIDANQGSMVCLSNDTLKRFAALVAAAEREACAAIARQWDVEHQGSNYGGCIATLMEARGQA